MTWFDYVFCGFFALGAFLTIITIGKPRKPITPFDAAMIVLIDVLLIVGVILTRT